MATKLAKLQSYKAEPTGATCDVDNVVLYLFTLVIGTFVAIPCARNTQVGFLKFIGGWTVAWVLFLGAHPTRVTTLVLIGVIGYGLAMFFFGEAVPDDAGSEIDGEE